MARSPAMVAPGRLARASTPQAGKATGSYHAPRKRRSAPSAGAAGELSTPAGRDPPVPQHRITPLPGLRERGRSTTRPALAAGSAPMQRTASPGPLPQPLSQGERGAERAPKRAPRVPSPESRIPNPWSLVPGPWSLVPGPWSLVPGPWSQVPSPWSLVPGP